MRRNRAKIDHPETASALNRPESSPAHDTFALGRKYESLSQKYHSNYM
jgi:hypothetical protein